MVAWTGLALGLLGSLLVVLLLSRLRERARARRWCALREPNQTMAGLELAVGVSRYVTTDSLQAIQEGLARNDREYAIRMLDSAAMLIEQQTPERLRRLRAMAHFARMVAALAPDSMPPVSRRRFALRELVTVAGIGAAFDHVLVGPPERFAMRMTVLAYGFRAALRTALHSQRRIHERKEAWDTFEAALSDWGVCEEEHLESFRALFFRSKGLE